ncbi:lysosomal-trafficking regulator-like isoform X2 [Acipenser ruthenus]|uniref:lysosomal-trafficking regulator-like isoform X2 n=1 Tax=Acipenser ruthenus TaxID=7906 RepID=UPI0027415CDF|nr:lysosomal-trafficking regulator-like isoform X2 [Acipenser ruthenus]
MTSLQPFNLSKAWEKYIHFRIHGADKQVSLECLERFLCLFHCSRHLENLNARDPVKFCSDMSSASNTLAREFLTDVHQLCNAVAQRAEAREEDEESHMVALGEYLVRGRGFLLLSTLDSIIDQETEDIPSILKQELTCREELLTLLLSLLPLVWKIPVQEDKAPDFSLPSLVDVFFAKDSKFPVLKAAQEKAGSEGQVILKRASGSWRARRQHRSAQRYSVRDARKSQLSTSDSDANSDDRTPRTSKHRRSHGLPLLVSRQHQPSTEGPLLTPPPTEAMSAFEKTEQQQQHYLSQVLDPEMLTDPAALSILNRMENSPFDLCHVLLSLLAKVCKFDMTLNHNTALAVSVVPTLTEFLMEFGDCCGPGGEGGKGGSGSEDLASGWTEEPIALIQRMLLRTILHLMSVDVGKREALPDNLRRNLTDLLRATLKIRSCLEKQPDPFAPRPKKTLQEIQDDFLFSKYRHRALLLPELLEGVLQVLLGCLQAATPNPFFFSQTVELIHEFVQHGGLELFEATVMQMEWLSSRDPDVSGEASERARGLISGVVNIVSAIKKAKSEQLHQSVCARRRHRRCEYSHFLHHHRDFTGLPVSAFKQPAGINPFEEEAPGGEVRYPKHCCCLAAYAHQCLHLLQRVSSSGAVCLQILASVQAVGICCCMDPRSVVAPLLHVFRSPALRSYQPHILSILGRLILEQLGGGQPSQKPKLASCNVCTMDSSQLPSLEETLQGNSGSGGGNESGHGFSSPSYRSQGILPSGGIEDMLWKWDALEAYQDLVFSDDQQLSLQIADHVCHLTQRGNVVVQWQLYAHIFNPVLQRGVELSHHAQQLGVTTSCAQVCSYHSKCLPLDVLQVYLQTLPSLLKSRVIRDLFLSCNGMNQVIELIYLDPVRSSALKVFETLILCVGIQQTDITLQELEIIEAEEREAALDLGDSPSNQPGRGVSEVPQSLSRFYAGLKEACPQKKSQGTRSGSEYHLNAINLFLCVVFLCVSKETDSDRDSANDSEDTSGYDSTASEPLGGRLPCLSPDSVALPSKEQIRRVADVWSVCRWIYLSSPVFQKQFYKLGGLDVCNRLMTMVIQKLSSKNKDGKAKKKQPSGDRNKVTGAVPSTGIASISPPCQEDDRQATDDFSNKGKSPQTEAEARGSDTAKNLEDEWPLQSIRLLEALLAICLHCASSGLQKVEPELSFQYLSVEETLSEMRDQLSRSGVVSSDQAIPLFNSLLRVALAETSADPKTPEEKTERKHQSEEEFPSQSGDLSEETEEPQCYNIKLFLEEQGYEADSESNPEDTAAKGEGTRPDAAPAVEGEFLSLPESSGQGELMYPEICMMELLLLSASTPHLDVLTHVFHSLLEVVRHSDRNAMLIYQQGAVKTILGGFQNILSQSDPSLEECQGVLVELLVALVSSHISSEELSLLIRIFLEKTPPTEILLNGVLHIVEANMHMAPLQYLTFPLVINSCSATSTSPMPKQSSTLGGKAPVLLRRGKVLPGRKEAESEAFNHQLSSSWHVAPVHLPLVGQNCWPHMSEGFSVSLWMKVENPPEAEGSAEKEMKPKRSKLVAFRDSSVDSIDGDKPAGIDHQNPPSSGDKLIEDGCLHIISLGSKALILQVWADLNTGAFIFRICIDPNDEMKAGLLAQAESQKNILTPGRWQHLALTYTQQPEGKKTIHGKLTLWVSGQRKSEVSLDYTLPRKSSLSSDSNKTFCMVGHCVPTQEEIPRLAGRWDIGTLLIFNGSRIGPEDAFYLYACGPDFTSIMPCKSGKPNVKYSKYITLEGLQCEQLKELLMKNKQVDTGSLIESLAIVYTPSCPSQYTIYEPVIRLKGQTKMMASQRPFSAKEIQSTVLDSLCLKALQPVQHRGLQSVLHEIGGTGAFVFLFGRAVELSDCEKTQAMALQVVLSLAKYNQHRVQEMESCNGYSMIHQVLIKSKCIVGFHILKTLLDGCCSGQILSLSEDGQFKLDPESNTVVQDVKLLSEVLLDWKIWAKAQCGVWETLLAALEIMIRVNHPQQMFNVKQFLKAQVIHRFLITCQVLQEHRDEHLTSIPRDVCRSFVKIFQEVLGSPPDLELLRLIYNFLLAVHPPTNTYVCHTPTSFYFSLHIDGKLYQEKVQSIMYLRHSSSGGKSGGSPGLSMSPSGFTEAPSEGGNMVFSTPEQECSPSVACEHQQQHPESFPESPSPSPQSPTDQQDRSLDELHKVNQNKFDSTMGDGSIVQRSTETLKWAKEDLLISSCESAQTVCDSREFPPCQNSALVNSCEAGSSPGQGDEETAGRRGESEDRFDSPGDEGVRRPASLKGVHSVQRSQSNFASLGLAFPAQNGSLAIARWPSLSDRGVLPEDWENYAYSHTYDRTYSKPDSTNDRSPTEDCLVLICCGLYDLLRGVLLILPDLMLEDVMDKLIQPEALIVLVNHPSPLIQQGVMKLLDAYFNRAFKEQKEKFLKNHGFSLLANQLYLHQGNQGLLECFLEMVFGRPVGLDEDLDLEDMEKIDPFRKRCIIPILGLIENSLYENTLVHNTLCVLLQLLNACPKVADILLDNGLLYVIFNTLAALNGLENGILLNDYKLLVCDIQQLLVAVTIHSCSSSGSQYFCIIEDLITLLGYLQISKNKRTQEMAVTLQFRVLQSAIEFIKTTANQDPQKLTSSVHLPAPQHHAIYQKRKSIAGSIAMKDSIMPRLPRQHFCSYGQIPMPPSFSLLNQESPLPSPTGSSAYVFPTEAGSRRFSLAQSDTLLMKMRSVASDELTVMMQRRMSQENPIRASETEYVQRLQRLTVLSVNRLIYQDVSQDFFDLLNIPESSIHQSSSAHQFEQPEENGNPQPTGNKTTFQKEILKLMMEGIKIGLGSSGRAGTPRQQWKRILWSCKDTFRVQIGRLLVHILCPARPLEERKQALEIVYEPSHSEILRECLSPSLEHGQKLALYLYELLHDHKDCLSKEEQAAVGIFMTSLKLCGHRCIPPSAPPKPDLIKAIKQEQMKYESEEKTNKTAWEKKMGNTQQSLIQRLDGKSKDISKIAADITQNVSLRQGMERKKVIQHIRGMYKIDLSASRHWQELVQQLTHDRAVWYDPASYPTSWQLDPTEGPNRERRRLQRCYLTIPNKYLLRDRQKPEEPVKPPLSYLFEDKTHSSFSSTVKDKATSEPIRFTRKCVSVAPSREITGELLLGKSGMYFVEDNAADTYDSPSPQGETEPASFSWTYEEIKEVHKRWWQLRDNAVEIFLTNGRTLLLAFDNTKVRDDVYHNILTSNLPNLLEYGNITALTHLWCSGQITNFEYLTHLNKHAGRSFNDLMQYPVFPFILSDYTSETLDLSETTIYRNLVKPIAVQSKEKEDRYVDNYKYLEEEFRKGARDDDPMPPVQPYHYGSHYSNSGTVLHFLVRMPPFTKMFLSYQDQSFDIPDRTFHSMNTTWRLSSYESMTDVKELIPEFFYLPEFLVNREGFDFGVRQNSERVNHVNLPPWARNDPRLFILIHRQALESDQVSQTLCQWIDLVFGQKQKGKAAVHAINVFHPATYFGMDVSAVEDPVQRRALETMIKTYGQTPRQLFNAGHMSRPASRLITEGELPAAMGLLVQFAFRETRELTKEVVYPSPLPWIKGLKWGEYVGSPSSPDPVVCFSQPHGERFGSLLALPTRAICGLSRKFCLMMIYSKEQGVRSMHSTDIQWSAILSWGYADNMLRLKSKQSEPPVNFIQCSQLHQVTSCAWVPDSCQLFTGSKCGVITAYSNRFTNTTPSEVEVESEVHLYGHTEEVTNLFACKPYSILISVSKDGTCIIWDLNRLCYVQSLTGHKSPVTAVSASETTGDIATVCDSVGGGSDLRLWTVNGDLIGHVHCREIICSVAFSNQPEGVSVNVIAGGLENGVVRLWSTWDLKPVREITFPKSNRPVVSLTYSCDGHHLYTANSEGTVIAWCRRDQQRMKLPMFYSFLSSYAA